MTFRSCGPILVVKLADKKDIYMITSKHDYDMTDTGKQCTVTKHKILKPTCIIDYNKNMGAIDRSDMMLSSCESARKCAKWYKKLFFHFIDICLLNSHCLYAALTNKKNATR